MIRTLSSLVVSHWVNRLFDASKARKFTASRLDIRPTFAIIIHGPISLSLDRHQTLCVAITRYYKLSFYSVYICLNLRKYYGCAKGSVSWCRNANRILYGQSTCVITRFWFRRICFTVISNWIRVSLLHWCYTSNVTTTISYCLRLHDAKLELDRRLDLQSAFRFSVVCYLIYCTVDRIIANFVAHCWLLIWVSIAVLCYSVLRCSLHRLQALRITATRYNKLGQYSINICLQLSFEYWSALVILGSLLDYVVDRRHTSWITHFRCFWQAVIFDCGLVGGLHWAYTIYTAWAVGNCLSLDKIKLILNLQFHGHCTFLVVWNLSNRVFYCILTNKIALSRLNERV